MTFKNLRDLINLTDSESVRAFCDGDNYPNTDYLILTEKDAMERVKDGYRGDEYMLGNFNASFIENYVCLDQETIEKMQEVEAFTGIGKAIMNSGHFDEMMEDYVETDGWGNALSSYDGNWDEYYVADDATNLIIIKQ